MILPFSMNSSRLCCCFLLKYWISSRYSSTPLGASMVSTSRDDGLHVLQGRRGGVQVIQGLLRALGDDGGDGGLAGAGGAVEDHVGGGPALDEPPQQGAGAQQVLLPRHLDPGPGAVFRLPMAAWRQPPFVWPGAQGPCRGNPQVLYHTPAAFAPPICIFPGGLVQ